MKSTEILNSLQVSLTIRRLCFQLIENHHNFSNTVLVGLQPNGVPLVNRLKKELEKISGNNIVTGSLDITFFRDDFRRKEKPLVPSITNIDFSIENKIVVLVDDVFFTGRTVRSGLDAIMTFGRPLSVEFLTLVERRFTQHLPIKADYIGQSIDTINEVKVSVLWKENEGEDQIILHTPEIE